MDVVALRVREDGAALAEMTLYGNDLRDEGLALLVDTLVPSNTLHPTPYTLHHTPYAPHPAPDTFKLSLGPYVVQLLSRDTPELRGGELTEMTLYGNDLRDEGLALLVDTLVPPGPPSIPGCHVTKAARSNALNVVA